MSKQKQEIRKLKQTVVELRWQNEQLKDVLARTEAKAKAYGERLEQVRGAHLIGLLKEAGIEYQLNTTQWQVTLPGGVLEVESLPVAIQAIRDAVSPPATDRPRYDDPALLGDKQ